MGHYLPRDRSHRIRGVTTNLPADWSGKRLLPIPREEGLRVGKGREVQRGEDVELGAVVYRRWEAEGSREATVCLTG